MHFQIIDNKLECPSIYNHGTGNIEKDLDLNQLSHTWAYHPRLQDLDIQYAQLYAAGKNLDEVCPDYLKEEWEIVKARHFAFQKSFKLAKISTFEHCFYDLVPENFSRKFFQIKSKISAHVLATYPKPKDYDSFVRLAEVIYDIRMRRLNIDPSYLYRKSYNTQAKDFIKKLKEIKPYIHYNMYGSVTGRLSIMPGFFPILNLKKEYREILKPNNDIFVELDFNGSQLRTLLALNETESPKGDIHDWNLSLLQHIYNEPLTRDDVKLKIFSWLFNNQASLGIPKLEELYNKEKALNKWWNGEKVISPFGNEVNADEWHALNYLIQRTEADVFFRRVFKIYDMLREKKTCIVYLIHDSMVLDFSMEDKTLLNSIIQEFGNTDLGKWKVNVKVGKNFGEMNNV